MVCVQPDNGVAYEREFDGRLEEQYHEDEQGVVGPVRRPEVELLVRVAPPAEQQVEQDRVEDEVVEHPDDSLGRRDRVVSALERAVHV